MYPDRFGQYRYYHHWLYSAAVAPLYGVLHWADPSGLQEYRAFRLLNTLCLLAFLTVAWVGRASWPLLSAMVLTLYSPLIAYCDWQHPELFCLSLTGCSFLLIFRPVGRYLAPALLGAAAAQNTPILMFFPLHLIGSLYEARPLDRRQKLRLLVAYAVGVAIAISPMVYCQYFFSTPNVISHVGLADLKFASLARVAHVFFSPISGAVWFYPACFAFLATGLTRRRIPSLLLALISVVVATWLCTSTRNFNSGQAGSVRYAVWLLAPLWCLVYAWAPDAWENRRRFAVFAVGVLLVAVTAFHFRLGTLNEKNIDRFGGCWRDVAEVRAFLRIIPYPDDPETLVENILGYEIQPWDFTGIYVWDLGKGQYLWLFSEKGLGRLRQLTLLSQGSTSVRVRRSPRQEGVLAPTSVGWGWQFPGDLRYQVHATFGRYVMARTSGPLEAIRCNIPVGIRSRSLRQIP